MNTGRTRFKKGCIPWNKGISVRLNPKGEFKKGLIPWNKRMKMSKEHKKKLSDGWIKRKEKGLGIVWNKGLRGVQKCSKETRKKMSKSHLKIRKKHWSWKGGITSKNKEIRRGIEHRLWREAIFARDGWTCQKCQEKGGNLHPHHILNFSQYPELRFAIDNGVTLCRECHLEFHKKYGRKNNNQEQLNEFLSNK